MTGVPMHACPGGCGTRVPYSLLSCRMDWWRLPDDVRREVSEAYRSKEPGRHLAAVRQAVEWYRDNPREATS